MYLHEASIHIYIFSKLLESQVIGLIKGELGESFLQENMLPASTSRLSSTSSEERQHIPISKTFNFNLQMDGCRSPFEKLVNAFEKEFLQMSLLPWQHCWHDVPIISEIVQYQFEVRGIPIQKYTVSLGNYRAVFRKQFSKE